MSRHYRLSLEVRIWVSEPKGAPNSNVCIIVRPHEAFSHEIVAQTIVFFINPMHVPNMPSFFKTSFHNQSFR